MDDRAIFDFGNFSIEIVDRPSVALNSEDRTALIRECIPVARSAFQNEGVEASDIEKHAIEVSTTIFVRDPQKALVAFASGVTKKQIAGRDIVYLEGTALRADWQNKQLYTPLIALRILIGARGGSGNSLVATRTQNPIVFKTMAGKFGLFPHLTGPVPNELKDTAEALAATVRNEHSDFQSAHGLNFDREYLVVRRAYGRNLADGREVGVCMHGDSKNIPWGTHGQADTDMNDFIKAHLDHQNGDAFLMIGEYNESQTMDVLRKSASKAGMDPATLEELIQSLS